MWKFDHFDLLAPLYDKVIHTHQSEKLINLMRLPAKGVLLDAGGGTGRVAKTLQPLIDKVVIADVSMGMLNQAAQKDSLLPICSLTEVLPFPQNTFDRIIIVDAIHHVYDARNTCLELWRVLKPGGVIVVEEPNIQHFAVKIVAVVEKLALMRSHFISPPKIADYFNLPKTKTAIHQDGYTSWIVVEKNN